MANFRPLSLDETISGQTWVARALDVHEFPPVDRPWPQWLQSGRDPDFDIYLPDAYGGELAAGEAFVYAQDALASQIATPVPGEAELEVFRAVNPQEHTTYSIDVPAGVATPVFAFKKNRGYVLIVNAGANPAFIAYGKDAGVNDLPLAAAGVGFHELVQGTVGSLSAFSAAGTRLVVIEGAYYPSVF